MKVVKGMGIAALTATLALQMATIASSPHRSQVPPGATTVKGGCGTTTLYKGASPVWTASAAPPEFLVQATGRADIVNAFIFGYPLQTGHRANRQNKILWVVRRPRDGTGLEISGHPLGHSAPVVRVRVAPDSQPGEIYPSVVNVPTAGCWHFTLRWHGNDDAIDLRYRNG
jgi:hypothetical protein